MFWPSASPAIVQTIRSELSSETGFSAARPTTVLSCSRYCRLYGRAASQNKQLRADQASRNIYIPSPAKSKERHKNVGLPAFAGIFTQEKQSCPVPFACTAF